MADRWSEALQTLRVVLTLYAQALSRSGMVGSLQDTFRSLSFALGKYSSSVEKRHREDVAIMGGTAAAMMGAVQGTSYATSDTSSPSSEVDSSSSDEVVDYGDSSDYVAAAASIGGELLLAGQLTAPSADSLKFAVSALELIGTHDNIFIMVRG